MQIAVRMAGYSMGEADTLRKAMGKKISAELMACNARSSSQGLRREGLPGAARRQDLFELIEPFADYGFNASHACAYGLHRVPDRVPEGASPASSTCRRC